MNKQEELKQSTAEAIEDLVNDPTPTDEEQKAKEVELIKSDIVKTIKEEIGFGTLAEFEQLVNLNVKNIIQELRKNNVKQVQPPKPIQPTKTPLEETNEILKTQQVSTRIFI